MTTVRSSWIQCILVRIVLRKRIAIAASVAIAILLSPLQASAYPFNLRGFQMLPRHCQAWYAGMLAGKNRSGELSQLGPNPARKYGISHWKKKAGGAWVFMNHYCPGLLDLVWVEFPSTSPPGKKNAAALLKHAEQGVDYQIKLAPWSKSNRWLEAEAHGKLGKIASLRGQHAMAIRKYQESISLDPTQILVYSALANEYEDLNMREEAIETLRKGLEIKPNSKIIAKKISRLEKSVDHHPSGDSQPAEKHQNGADTSPPPDQQPNRN